MARSRNIKPGFFANEILAEVDPLGRLLFAGLWTIADREGRLEDREKRIKRDVLPYDNCDIGGLLTQLSERGFIERYESNGNKYIQVNNWHKHQNPHIKEPASEIPAPDEYGTSTIQEPVEHGSGPADSLNPITDSFNPITITETSFADVKKFFDNNIHMATPFEIQKLQAWAEDVSTDVIMKALERSVEAGVRKFSYIDGILKNLLADGITTIEAWNENERKKEVANHGQPSSNTGTTQTKTNKYANLDFSKLE
jgi:DnaD/phage-associated family protein